MQPQISRLEAQAEYERSRDRAAALAEKEAEAAKDQARLDKVKVRRLLGVCVSVWKRCMGGRALCGHRQGGGANRGNQGPS